MNARERARLLHWDIEPTPPVERDQAGIVMAAQIRIWNAEAAKAYAGWRKLAEDLDLLK